MTLKDLTEHITIFVDPLKTSGCYIGRIRGCTPDGERIKFDIEVSGCYTEQILQDTLTAQLEEILECKYHYEIGEYDEEDLCYDGGTFK